MAAVFLTLLSSTYCQCPTLNGKGTRPQDIRKKSNQNTMVAFTERLIWHYFNTSNTRCKQLLQACTQQTAVKTQKPYQTGKH